MITIKNNILNANFFLSFISGHLSNYNIYAYKTYGELYTPQKKGYTFDGWYKESDFKNKISSSTTLSNDNPTATLPTLAFLSTEM